MQIFETLLGPTLDHGTGSLEALFLVGLIACVALGTALLAAAIARHTPR